MQMKQKFKLMGLLLSLLLTTAIVFSVTAQDGADGTDVDVTDSNATGTNGGNGADGGDDPGGNGGGGGDASVTNNGDATGGSGGNGGATDEGSGGNGGGGGDEAGSGEGGGDAGPRQNDDLYDDAIEVVVREGRGSCSLLQRCLGIGYGRAARLIDFMAEDQIVGEYNGSQAREVLISAAEWEAMTSGDGEAPAAAATAVTAPTAGKICNANSTKNTSRSPHFIAKFRPRGINRRNGATSDMRYTITAGITPTIQIAPSPAQTTNTHGSRAPMRST